MLNDFYALLDEDRVHFFPTSYKKSILYGKEDAQGLVQRTNTLNAIRRNDAPYIVVCTYPEALARTRGRRNNPHGPQPARGGG